MPVKRSGTNGEKHRQRTIPNIMRYSWCNVLQKLTLLLPTPALFLVSLLHYLRPSASLPSTFFISVPSLAPSSSCYAARVCNAAKDRKKMQLINDQKVGPAGRFLRRSRRKRLLRVSIPENSTLRIFSLNSPFFRQAPRNFSTTDYRLAVDRRSIA